MDKRLYVAAIQMNAGPDKDRNIRSAARLVTRAALRWARFILLPETFNFRGKWEKGADIAEDIPGPSTQPLIGIAASRDVWILAGSVYERAPGSKRSYNSSALIGPDGKIKAVYRKLHLFDVSLGNKKMSESRSCLKGKEPVLASVSGIRTGFSICYDLRFPELYRRYSGMGARILCVPSSFTRATGMAHWEVLLRARAIENQSFVIAPNQFGIGLGGAPTYGRSMIIDPWGGILASASLDREEIIYADLDLVRLERMRMEFPALRHRRIDYA